MQSYSLYSGRIVNNTLVTVWTWDAQVRQFSHWQQKETDKIRGKQFWARKVEFSTCFEFHAPLEIHNPIE